jgi:hypothetical protein
MVALMHDGSEAYTGDINANIKRVVPSFQPIEDGIQNVIYKKFAFIPNAEDAATVLYADLQMLKIEAHHVLKSGWEGLSCVDKLREIETPDIKIMCLDRMQAHRAFLDRFHALGGFEVKK